MQYEKPLDNSSNSCYLDLNAWNGNSTYAGPLERSRVVRGFGDLYMEPVREQQERKPFLSETSVGGHRYQRHVSDSLQ